MVNGKEFTKILLFYILGIIQTVNQFLEIKRLNFTHWRGYTYFSQKKIAQSDNLHITYDTHDIIIKKGNYKIN